MKPIRLFSSATRVAPTRSPASLTRSALALALSIAALGGLVGLEPARADDSANAPVATAAVDALDPLTGIQARWAEIRYQLPEAERVKAFDALVNEIGRAQQRTPDDLRLQVWKGIVLASEAGAQGGLGALSLCKQARKEFEAVIEKDGQVLDGSAYTSLGSLYYQVPGWPIGFGDEDKARELLQQGLSIAPDGIDANYFWGDFLLDQEDYAGAVQAFQKALSAPPRPGRESADAGRRAEIEAGLAKAQEELRG
ncbi:tetratricopeptide repeat protein [Aquimonas voraii]|uniref:Tetratricopeptide repeat-containing protein n=1 Tax=Aquimonas voraii TaxID=265719 RepID=A0A1G6XAR6_9GAMM|nr:tetratricopeptide repeat protein [Aquimonas voraii]SDD75238.1 Tetratricopeptide repeat-containing protein [Aquimonas voraii]